MDKTLMEIEGMLTTQSHLIELLLGAHLAQGIDPPGNVGELRAMLDLRFRRDMAAFSTTPMAIIQTTALKAVTSR